MGHHLLLLRPKFKVLGVRPVAIQSVVAYGRISSVVLSIRKPSVSIFNGEKIASIDRRDAEEAEKTQRNIQGLVYHSLLRLLYLSHRTNFRMALLRRRFRRSAIFRTQTDQY